MVSLNTTFKDLAMPMIHNLIPNFYNLEGWATGRLKIFGTLDQTNFDFNTEVKEAVFDRVFIGDIDSKGNYSANRLDIDYANSKNKEEIIKSYGSVPFDLNLSSKNFGRFFENDSLDFHAKANLKSMLFLSPYIPELDSVRGAVDIALSLTGPSSAIVRNGSIM